jgi:hypothetical protein
MLIAMTFICNSESATGRAKLGKRLVNGALSGIK